METTKQTNNFSRFQVFIGEQHDDGSVKKSKSVGMAYLGEHQTIFSLRLWTFSWERFFILPDKNNPAKYLIMTREPSKSPNSKNKYYWNIVGNGTADSKNAIIRLEFDLIEKPLYMNIFPETSAHSKNVPAPDTLSDAA